MKPKLFKDFDGLWICTDGYGTEGDGTTPKRAYADMVRIQIEKAITAETAMVWRDMYCKPPSLIDVCMDRLMRFVKRTA